MNETFFLIYFKIILDGLGRARDDDCLCVGDDRKKSKDINM